MKFKISKHCRRPVPLKVRVVARGFEQEEGFNRQVSIRLILSLAASNNMKLMTFDVKTAFLYGTLKEELYMNELEGFEDGTKTECVGCTSLYEYKKKPEKLY